MSDQRLPSDIPAIARACACMGVAITPTQIASTMGIPFILLGSEEWLDRATLQLYPRMRTTIPERLIGFRQQCYDRIAAHGVHITTRWCADVTAVEVILDQLDQTTSVWVCFTAIEGHYPVFVRRSENWTSVDDETSDWRGSVSTMHAPNGFLWVGLSLCAPTPVLSVAEQAAWAASLIASDEVFRFPTPTHPVRLWQAWHLGAASLEVIALAAEEAAPLSIVSDTVAFVFAQYAERARLAQQVVAAWSADARLPEHSRSALHSLEAAYHDVIFLFEIVTTQYPVAGQIRALSRAEGALIAEVCRDTRLVYREISALFSVLGGNDIK